MADSLSAELALYQRDFVRRFLAPNAPRYQLLLAPVGTGKTFTASAIVDSILRTPSRVLFVTPIGMRTLEYALGPSLPWTEIKITKAWLRERSSEPDGADGGWPAWMLGVVNPRTLADSWVAKELATTDWDLVVVDEANSLGPRAERAVHQLLVEETVRRLLVLGIPTMELPLGSIGGLHVESWKLSALGRNGLPAVEQVHNFHSVLFERSPDERSLLQRVQRLLEETEHYSIEWGIHDLDQAASSSPYALQARALQALERLRSRRNALAHGRTAGDVVTSRTRAAEFGQLSMVVDELQAIADAVDRLGEDSRYATFTELLRVGSVRLGEERVVVFCAEQSTADYIANGLTILERPFLRIRAEGTPLADISSALRRPNTIVVADDQAVAGLDLVNARQVINYDLVPDVRRMLARWLSVGGAHRSPLEVWTLLDRSPEGLPEGQALQLMPYLAGVGLDRQ
jgi:hypothetical protein